VLGGRVGNPVRRGLKSTVARVLTTPTQTGPLWVFGGSSGRSYSDNSSVLHRHTIETRPDVEALWVMDADSKDRNLARSVGRVVDRNSLDAHRIARGADVIVFSHGIHDVPGMMGCSNALRVRLGHGLTAFGRTKGRLPRSTQRMTQAVDLAPVASKMEQDHKVDWGFPRSKLPITGLPRWDAMLAARASTGQVGQRPQVLYTPTSRPWHRPEDASPSGGLRPIHQLLTSPRLRSLLMDGAFDLNVYFHQITRHRFGTFDWLPDRVTILEDEAELPRRIAEASLVVSDYSSILWDALYLDIPVIFFQFDRKEHEERRGSYLDLNAPLFGPNLDESSEVVDALEIAVSDGFELVPWRSDRSRWQRRAFAFRDARNSERVIETIEAHLQRG
jgi:CDP-glycerol glycerophosphotransferase